MTSCEVRSCRSTFELLWTLVYPLIVLNPFWTLVNPCEPFETLVKPLVKRLSLVRIWHALCRCGAGNLHFVVTHKIALVAGGLAARRKAIGKTPSWCKFRTWIFYCIINFLSRTVRDANLRDEPVKHCEKRNFWKSSVEHCEKNFLEFWGFLFRIASHEYETCQVPKTSSFKAGLHYATTIIRVANLEDRSAKKYNFFGKVWWNVLTRIVEIFILYFQSEIWNLLSPFNIISHSNDFLVLVMQN